MKKVNNKEFTIEKNTVRDLTSQELNQVAGASDCPGHPEYPIVVPYFNYQILV
jgi:hypothetical protein